jgi:hypothetical protein
MDFSGHHHEDVDPAVYEAEVEELFKVIGKNSALVQRLKTFGEINKGAITLDELRALAGKPRPVAHHGHH